MFVRKHFNSRRKETLRIEFFRARENPSWVRVFVLFVAHCTSFKYIAYIMKQGAEKNSSDFSRPRFWRHCNLLKGSWYLIVNIKIFPYDERIWAEMVKIGRCMKNIYIPFNSFSNTEIFLEGSRNWKDKSISALLLLNFGFKLISKA